MVDALYPVLPEIAAHTSLTAAQHAEWTAAAKADPEHYWLHQAKRIDWMTPPTVAQRGDFTGDVHVTWYEDGVLNASANCLDRHLATRGDQVAIIWEGDDPGETRSVTYRALHEQVCRFSNVLLGLGVQKGDRVTLYLPMVIEAAVAMLACARIGAVHAIVFGGFSPDSLAQRMTDCDSTVLITADEGRRGGRRVALKTNADLALAQCPGVKAVVVVEVTGAAVPMQAGRDHSYAALMAQASAECAPARMGMRKKTALAVALIHRPRVLFLDEPFNGMDTLAVRAVCDALRRLTEGGATVFFSSHVLEMVERLCTRIAILTQGRIVACGTLPEVRALSGVPPEASLEDAYLALAVPSHRPALPAWL